jgi:hypothetical protein
VRLPGKFTVDLSRAANQEKIRPIHQGDHHARTIYFSDSYFRWFIFGTALRRRVDHPLGDAQAAEQAALDAA